jgi:NADH-quinone oxidoreductase subunit H
VKQQPIKGYAITMVLLGLCFFGVAAAYMIPAFNAVAAPVFWFLLKLITALYVMIWVRGTFPRYRYDQLMNIGWKVLIPTALGAIFVNALVGMLRG